MNDEPELEESPLAGPLISGGRTVRVHIYRLIGQAEWTLEIADEYNNSTVWDETFASDSAALIEANKAILEGTISTFTGSADGKSTSEWQ